MKIRWKRCDKPRKHNNCWKLRVNLSFCVYIFCHSVQINYKDRNGNSVQKKINYLKYVIFVCVHARECFCCVVCVYVRVECRMVGGMLVEVCLVEWGYLFYVTTDFISFHQSYNLCIGNVLNYVKMKNNCIPKTICIDYESIPKTIERFFFNRATANANTSTKSKSL